LLVIDFSRVIAGPFASQLLGDLGADVIKVEEPVSGDPSRKNPPHVGGESHYFMAFNRNKKSVAFDLKTSAGRQAAFDLMNQADIVVENFRPSVMKNLKLDYDSVKTTNPRLIYCSISGFGREGPLHDVPAYNEVVQAITGIMSMNGEENGPPIKLGVPIGDLGGALFAVIGILAAVNDRARTGKGQWVDIALYDSMISMLGYFANLYFTTGKSPTRIGSAHHSIGPLGVFMTADKSYLALSIFTDKFWSNFCSVIGRPELATDSRFVTAAGRVGNKHILKKMLEELFLQSTLAQWDSLLTDADVPHAPVRSVGEALEAEHSKQRDMVIELEHPTAGRIRNTGRAIKLSNHDSKAPMKAAPLLGADTVDVLRHVLKYSETQIEEMTKQGAAKQWQGKQR
jgi:formyl-CoA transferase/CoA:oxalate CoA-transferase